MRELGRGREKRDARVARRERKEEGKRKESERVKIALLIKTWIRRWS